MKVGYARASTADQSLNLQIDALQKAGCEKICSDQGISGAKSDRPGLNEALEYVRKGDTLVIWKLDRLGRSLKHLIEVVEALGEQGVNFESLQDGFDTSTANGRLVFHIFCSLAQFERELTRERTMAGLASARSRGRMGGRPKQLEEAQVKVAIALANAGELNIKEICSQIDCSRSTYYRQVAPRLKKMKSAAVA